jgi:hypothetical protein
MIAYAKLAGILAVVVGLFGLGFHFGGMGPTAALERLQAAQAADVAKAVLAERASVAAELARVNGILKEYEDNALHPIDLHIGSRVLVAACPAQRPLPETSPNPGRTQPTAQGAGVDPRLGPALDRVISDCQADARQLSALQAGWPR